MSFDHGLNDAESEASPSVFPVGGKERSKNFVPVPGRNAPAIILHIQNDFVVFLSDIQLNPCGFVLQAVGRQVGKRRFENIR